LINLAVLLETGWVLRSRYGFSKADIMAAFSVMLEAQDVEFEDEAAVEEALYSWKNSPADFADCMIGARNRRLGCRATATFDRKALSLAGFVTV
jgi:predicted nucleic-acid-binding protein